MIDLGKSCEITTLKFGVPQFGSTETIVVSLSATDHHEPVVYYPNTPNTQLKLLLSRESRVLHQKLPRRSWRTL